jgi:hypothetical protein
MEILPLKGLDTIRFGNSRSKAECLYGVPDSISNKDAVDGVSSEIWSYDGLGITLYFSPDNSRLLESLIVLSPDISLGEIKPVGLTEAELKSVFANLRLEVADGKYKEYSLSDKKLEFWLKGGIVTKVWVWSAGIF